jgi:hypothetical protein
MRMPATIIIRRAICKRYTRFSCERMLAQQRTTNTCSLCVRCVGVETMAIFARRLKTFATQKALFAAFTEA